VSRQHASIERRGAAYVLIDSESTHGTWIRGQRIDRPVRLADGLRFTIGRNTLLFESQTEEDETAIGSTVIQARSLASAITRAEDPERLRRHLLETLREFGPCVEQDEVLDRILHACLRIFPEAGRVLVMLADKPGGKLLPAAFRSRDREGIKAISQSVLSRVLTKRQGLLCRNPIRDFPEAASIVENGLGAFLCVPLLDPSQEPIGAIQVDVGSQGGSLVEADLEVLVALAAPFSNALATARLHRRILREAAMELELKAASRVLSELLPPPGPAIPGYEIATYYQPARHVGGDYVGALPWPSPEDLPGESPRRWSFAVGDVSGKGLTAALLMARLSVEVRVAIQTEIDGLRVLARMSRELQQGRPGAMYVTFLLVVIDRVENKAWSFSAGHWPPLLRRADGRVIAGDTDASGLPLPWFDPSEARALEWSLEPGDMLCLFTDGVLEARSADGEFFSHERLKRLLGESPGGAPATCRAIRLALTEHAGDHPQFDDIALCCIARGDDRPAEPLY
ncbi:MAG: SpoIIE family protein phosphatase, partial [Isosphaeraceae bacterium]